MLINAGLDNLRYLCFNIQLRRKRDRSLLHGLGEAVQGRPQAFFKKWSLKPFINWDLFTSLAGFLEDAIVDNIDEECDRLVQHPHDSKESQGFKIHQQTVQ
ncbi:hypothetical protein ANCDUO_02281 [Ancylostoma duodenale]|uniref:Uncharacterized protein n=1 Tax=Ancylostoma duodenale TaxID=51022 RepID=A0A0C2H0Y2_9BILA|nr:hypothetical protein ANCDUO_02281 [Ancylostoma duodenale]